MRLMVPVVPMLISQPPSTRMKSKNFIGSAFGVGRNCRRVPSIGAPSGAVASALNKSPASWSLKYKASPTTRTVTGDLKCGVTGASARHANALSPVLCRIDTRRS